MTARRSSAKKPKKKRPPFEEPTSAELDGVQAIPTDQLAGHDLRTLAAVFVTLYRTAPAERPHREAVVVRLLDEAIAQHAPCSSTRCPLCSDYRSWLLGDLKMLKRAADPGSPAATPATPAVTTDTPTPPVQAPMPELVTGAHSVEPAPAPRKQPGERPGLSLRGKSLLDGGYWSRVSNDTADVAAVEHVTSLMWKADPTAPRAAIPAALACFDKLQIWGELKNGGTVRFVEGVSYLALGRMTGYSRRTIARGLQLLQSVGLVRLEKRGSSKDGGLTNTYWVAVRLADARLGTDDDEVDL